MRMYRSGIGERGLHVTRRDLGRSPPGAVTVVQLRRLGAARTCIGTRWTWRCHTTGPGGPLGVGKCGHRRPAARLALRCHRAGGGRARREQHAATGQGRIHGSRPDDRDALAGWGRSGRPGRRDRPDRPDPDHRAQGSLRQGAAQARPRPVAVQLRRQLRWTAPSTATSGSLQDTNSTGFHTGNTCFKDTRRTIQVRAREAAPGGAQVPSLVRVRRARAPVLDQVHRRHGRHPDQVLPDLRPMGGPRQVPDRRARDRPPRRLLDVSPRPDLRPVAGVGRDRRRRVVVEVPAPDHPLAALQRPQPQDATPDGTAWCGRPRDSTPTACCGRRRSCASPSTAAQCFKRSWTPKLPQRAPQPFDHPFSFILHMGVGPRKGPHAVTAKTKVPATFVVDYAKAWR